MPASETSRVLVVPESINPGWIAHRADGTRLTPVTVNGWQQGWVLPPGTEGPVTLAFTSNALYRAGLIGGLALLPLLALLAFLPVRRRRPSRTRQRACGQPGRVSASVAVLAVGAVISGVAGVVVVGVGPWRAVSAAQPRKALRRSHGHHDRGRADPGGRGAQPESVAVGRRIRRALRRGSVAGPHLGGDAGGVDRV